MKKIIAAFLFLISTTGFSQSIITKTDMPAAFCQPGHSYLGSNIWLPLTLQNPITHQFYSTLERYDTLGVRKDSIYIYQPNHNYYSVQSALEKGNFIYVTGVKNSCDQPSKYFLGKVNVATKNYQEIKDYPALSNKEVIKGMFNASSSQLGFYTNNAVFIVDLTNDSLHLVMNNVGGVAAVNFLDNNIIVGASTGLFKINPANIYSADTLIADMVRKMTIDFENYLIYTASNFYIIRTNRSLQIQDSLHLASGPLNIGAPQQMSATNNRLYLLDGNRIYITDSNFSFVAPSFTIGYQVGNTRINSFKIINNRLIILGVKGHFYSPKSSYPWFFGSYPLSVSQAVNLKAKLIYCEIDTLIKMNQNGEDFLKAKFKFSLKNTSPSINIQRFTAQFTINGSLCSGYKNQEHFVNQNLQANTSNAFVTGWLSFGPINNIGDYNSHNTRFLTTISAINKTDYGSTLDLSLTTPAYGFLNIYEDTIEAKISPNPFTNKLIIEGNFKKPAQAIIYNANGATAWSGKLKKKKTVISLSNLENGIYFIYVNNGQNSFSQKLVKQ